MWIHDKGWVFFIMWIHPYIGTTMWIYFLPLYTNDEFSLKCDTSLYRESRTSRCTNTAKKRIRLYIDLRNKANSNLFFFFLIKCYLFHYFYLFIFLFLSFFFFFFFFQY